MINRFRPGRSPRGESADGSRRSFFWKLGAGATGVLASSAVVASNESGDADGLALKVALLEEEKALREFHRRFEQAMDKGLFEDTLAMFADDAQVVFNRGVFDNRSNGLKRLFARFDAGKTGKRIEPAPGYEIDAERQQDRVEVAADRSTARAAFPYSIQVGAPLESETSLAGMARLHGEGVRTWWEGGVYHLSYTKSAADGEWKIGRLEYETLSRADWRPGRSYAGPITAPRFSALYPEDPQGPDTLA